MAAINDLISQIQDETLRNRIQEEVSKMAKQKKFGLVFEEHMPESTPLYDMPIKRGCNVMRRDSKDDKSIYVVLRVEGDTAVCVKPEQKDEAVTFDLKDIVRVAEFGESIYPYLKPLDSVCNAPDSDLWHTLIEADNYHALQLLEYLYAGTYLADDAEFDTSENIADNKKEFYEISLIENYRPFTFLDDAEKRTEYYSESDRNKLSGFLFRINLNDKYFWVYQHIYSVSRIDRSKNVIALFVGDTYDEIDSDIVQIDSRADVIIFSSSVVTAKMDLMQRFFGFEQYIRAGAQKTIEIILDLDIVDSLEKFVAFENKSKLTNAKKLLKAKNSPVLQMKKNDLLENLKKHSRYKTMFKFEEDHIVISSQKEAAAFIKMLNDDIVRSELTGKEYDSSSKMLLGPVGASH